ASEKPQRHHFLVFQSPKLNFKELWWPGTESNRRRQPFQGCALPTELPGQFWLGYIRAASVGPKMKTLCVRNVFDYNNDFDFPQIALGIHSKTLVSSDFWCNSLNRLPVSGRSAWQRVKSAAP